MVTSSPASASILGMPTPRQCASLLRPWRLGDTSALTMASPHMLPYVTPTQNHFLCACLRPNDIQRPAVSLLTLTCCSTLMVGRATCGRKTSSRSCCL